jgi:hypothetical protein
MSKETKSQETNKKPFLLFILILVFANAIMTVTYFIKINKGDVCDDYLSRSSLPAEAICLPTVTEVRGIPHYVYSYQTEDQVFGAYINTEISGKNYALGLLVWSATIAALYGTTSVLLKNKKS